MPSRRRAGRVNLTILVIVPLDCYLHIFNTLQRQSFSGKRLRYAKARCWSSLKSQTVPPSQRKNKRTKRGILRRTARNPPYVSDIERLQATLITSENDIRTTSPSTSYRHSSRCLTFDILSAKWLEKFNRQIEEEYVGL